MAADSYLNHYVIIHTLNTSTFMLQIFIWKLMNY